ncbi:MAG: hypothetical protein JWR50_4308 [Mucilaginibacter sp.]|nr:hypothetical protein [Mucilaginibacter sp.]
MDNTASSMDFITTVNLTRKSLFFCGQTLIIKNHFFYDLKKLADLDLN